ncbi:MAG: HD domain-containing protein [Clostridia bacterium]|jgi:3'-5' exoribonuclease|nr:HD domain-containing protein [Clostridia bacterium]
MGRMNLLSNCINNSTGAVEGFCLVKSVQVKNNVKGADYLDFTLADAGGEVNAKLWDYRTETHGVFAVGDIIKVRGTVNLWKDVEQLKIDRIRHKTESDSVDMSAIVASSPVDGEDTFRRIYEFADTFADKDLTLLTQYLLRGRKEAIESYPAALRLHHACRGGLMFHTGTMLEIAKKVVEVYKPLYPELSSDLVYCGVILHDIAKTEELDVGPLGVATAYSMRGQLMGHINMGVSMVEQAAAELQLPEELTTLVSHILLSHHGQPDFGSPKFPMFPEAEIVSEIDMLDARMFEMFDALSGVEVGQFTERQWSMDNRQLFRHGHGTRKN